MALNRCERGRVAVERDVLEHAAALKNFVDVSVDRHGRVPGVFSEFGELREDGQGEGGVKPKQSGCGRLRQVVKQAIGVSDFCVFPLDLVNTDQELCDNCIRFFTGALTGVPLGSGPGPCESVTA